ncbi:MAG: cell division protein FtsQ, partial [Alphaproteobacteria bacterium]|nr:cell division protein FtsQ [Alphaproteobacteria bacterium]
MKKKLKAAVYVDKRRWNLHLSNEVLVKLPEENFADALQSLVAMEENQKLGTRDISVVDLRFLPHVVLQMKDKIPARPNSRKPGIGKSRGKEA